MADLVLTLAGPATALTILADYRGNKVVGVLDKWVDLYEGAGGDDYADTGTTADETTQANELWVAGFSLRGGDMGVDRSYAFDFEEVVALGDLAGLQTSLAHKIVSATGHPHGRLSHAESADNMNLVAAFKAAGVPPIEFVDYSYGWSGGSPASVINQSLEGYEENDLLVLWVVLDYEDAHTAPSARPIITGDLTGWTKIDEMTIDDHYWAFMYYALAPVPPTPSTVIGSGVLSIVQDSPGTPGHIIVGPDGESI